MIKKNVDKSYDIDFNVILQKFQTGIEFYLKVRLNYGIEDERSCFGFPRGATFLFDNHHGIHEYNYRTHYLEDIGILKNEVIKEALVKKLTDIISIDYNPENDEYCYIFESNNNEPDKLGYSWCYMYDKVIPEKCK